MIPRSAPPPLLPRWLAELRSSVPGHSDGEAPLEKTLKLAPTSGALGATVYGGAVSESGDSGRPQS